MKRDFIDRVLNAMIAGATFFACIMLMHVIIVLIFGP